MYAAPKILKASRDLTTPPFRGFVICGLGLNCHDQADYQIRYSICLHPLWYERRHKMWKIGSPGSLKITRNSDFAPALRPRGPRGQKHGTARQELLWMVHRLAGAAGQSAAVAGRTGKYPRSVVLASQSWPSSSGSLSCCSSSGASSNISTCSIAAGKHSSLPRRKFHWLDVEDRRR